MTVYRLEYEMEDGTFDTIETTDEDEITDQFHELKNDPECMLAQLKKQYIYGGICQGEDPIDGFNRYPR